MEQPIAKTQPRMPPLSRRAYFVAIWVIATLLGGGILPVQAIEFTAPVVVAWTWLEDLDYGCKARLGQQIHNRIFVGTCKGRVPHGRGILFENNKSSAVRVNEGKIYKTDPINKESDVEQFVPAANYIAAFNSLFLLNHDFKSPLPNPNGSAVYRAAEIYLRTYGESAPGEELTQARRQQELARLAAFEHALATLNYRRSSPEVTDMQSRWQGHLNSSQEFTLKSLQQTFAKAEQLERDRQAEIEADNAQRAAASALARQKWRDSRMKTSCNDFYPGYVARYNRGGLFDTADSYVVRYLNADRKSVTIEGRASGNSLSYGQIVELSCIDLLERSQ